MMISICLIAFSPVEIHVNRLMGLYLKRVFVMARLCSAQNCKSLNPLSFDPSRIYCLTTSGMSSECISPAVELKSPRSAILDFFINQVNLAIVI